jgi:outer membrane protein TolC
VIREALSNNATLQAAQASLRQSQERLKAGFDATRQKFSPARFGETSQGSIFSLYTLTGTVSYTLDVFGGERRAVEGLQSQVEFQRYAVLAAFGQVADVLRALEHDAQALQSQSQAVDTSEEVMRLVQANYRAGLANYLQVLIANAQNHQARIGYVQASALRLQDTVALFVALGGGWWNLGEKPLDDLTQGVAPSPDAFPILPRLDDKKE